MRLLPLCYAFLGFPAISYAEVSYDDDVFPGVFDPHCIECHSSDLTGADRNGAPVGVNFNTFALATSGMNAQRAVTRVTAGTMPPSGPLSQVLQDLMLDWQVVGFLQSTPTPTPTPTLTPESGGELGNISTRGFIGTGDQVLIGGLIVIGEPTRVLIRAQGPSLAGFGVSGVINDPTLELFFGQNSIASNDDWQSALNQTEIESSGLAPNDTREPAILITLDPGSYTAIVRGENGAVGIGLVEVFKIEN